MLRILFSLLMFSFFLFAQEKKKDNLIIAFYSKANLIENEQRTKIALELWKNQFLEKEGIDIQIKFYDNLPLMKQDFLNEKIDISSFETLYVLENENSFNNSFKKLWTIEFDDAFIDYVLVQKKEFKNELFLNNRILGYTKDESEALLWLDKLSLSKFKTKSKNMIKSYKVYKKDLSVLIDNYFGRTDMSIVSKKSWDIMKELNPNISKKLEVVALSPKIFIINMGMFRKNFPNELIDKLVDSANKMIYNKNSKHVFELLNINAFRVVEKDYYEKIKNYYKDYKRLENEEKK